MKAAEVREWRGGLRQPAAVEGLSGCTALDCTGSKRKGSTRE